jgi:methionyl-tRNA formyltransferase
MFTADHAWVDWRRPAKQVFDLIRGANPAPAARTYARGQTVTLFDSVLLAEPGSARPGTITAVTGEGFTVAAQGGSILVKQAGLPGSAPVDAGTICGQLGLGVGDVLGLKDTSQ